MATPIVPQPNDEDAAKRSEEVGSNAYRGTAAALVAAGIVQLDQLPGQPGRPEREVFYRDGVQVERVRRIDHQPDSERWMKIRYFGDGIYLVNLGIPREERLRRLNKSFQESRERDARWRAEREEHKRQEAVRQAAFRAGQRAYYTGMTEDDFRKKLEDALMGSVIVVLPHVAGYEDENVALYPFRLQSESFEALRSRFFEIADMIRSVPVIPTTGIAAARADSAFQSFLRGQCLGEGTGDIQ